MLKKVITLVILISILVALLWIRPDTETVDSSIYTMVEYKITNIDGNQYYGEAEDGTEISFSDKDTPFNDKIQVHDVIICYFEKDNFGKGLVKVAKK